MTPYIEQGLLGQAKDLADDPTDVGGSDTSDVIGRAGRSHAFSARREAPVFQGSVTPK